MIYFDNAATTMQKPPEVMQAVVDAMSSFGGVGRGVHPAAVAAAMGVYGAREAISSLLGAEGPDCVSFASNATEALNIAIAGLLPDGGVAITTASSHNSVLRPLFAARDKRGCEIRIVPVDGHGALDYDAFEQALEGADLAVVTHASNVTGDVYDAGRLCAMTHDAGAAFVLDAAQTAGCMDLNAKEIGADVVCFTGHKGLLGPQGTGGLVVSRGVDVPPLLEGGSGSHSFDERHPRFMPEALEAGTPNAHGLAGLAAGAEYVANRGAASIGAHEKALADRFETALRAIPEVVVYGGGGDVGKLGIVAFNVADIDAGEVADVLANEFGVCTRAGAHCAPLMHKALGTAEQGVVRASFGPFNTEDEVDAAAAAVSSIAKSACQGE